MAVQNSLNAVAQALEEGMAIQKLHLVANSDVDPDRQLEFTLDAGLAVSGLKLPKAEKRRGRGCDISHKRRPLLMGGGYGGGDGYSLKR